MSPRTDVADAPAIAALVTSASVGLFGDADIVNVMCAARRPAARASLAADRFFFFFFSQ